jgi:hypothetical protein
MAAAGVEGGRDGEVGREEGREGGGERVSTASCEKQCAQIATKQKTMPSVPLWDFIRGSIGPGWGSKAS